MGGKRCLIFDLSDGRVASREKVHVSVLVLIVASWSPKGERRLPHSTHHTYSNSRLQRPSVPLPCSHWNSRHEGKETTHDKLRDSVGLCPRIKSHQIEISAHRIRRAHTLSQCACGHYYLNDQPTVTKCQLSHISAHVFVLDGG